MSINLSADLGVINASHTIWRDGTPEIYNTPTMMHGSKKILDRFALKEQMQAEHVEVVILEQGASRPGNSGVSMFSFGRCEGVWEGLTAGLGIPLKYVTPQKWKRDLGLSQDKEASRQLAIELYPNLADFLRFKKDHNRAEALLIGHWHMNQPLPTPANDNEKVEL